MKVAIISLGSVSSKMIAEESEKYFEKVDLLDIRNIEVNVGAGATGVLYQGKPLEKYDCVLVRGSFKYANIQRAITTLLDGKCYMPYPAQVFSIVHDKLLTHLELEKANIPMPKTYLTPTPKAAKSVLEQVLYPIIMKIPNGTQGKGVMFSDSFASATSMLDTLATLKQPFLIQEFVETDGSDIRVIVIGNKVVACMKRKSSGEDKRSNLHAGGSAEAIYPDDTIKRIAVKTAKVLGAEICGVDILESIKGPLVIEANLNPGLQGITKSTKINVAEKIAIYLAKNTTEFLENAGNNNSLKSLLKEEGISHEKEKEVKKNPSNIITTLDFRGERILLPKIVSSSFKEEEECIIETSNKEITIKKL